MSLLIHKAGIQASIQDLGRRGYQQLGIPISGAMDESATKLANIICGNTIDKSVIEFTLHGAMVEFTMPHRIALTGGGSRVTINGEPAPMNQLLLVAAGALLSMQPCNLGCRTYLAIEGGFKVERELGSTSTYQTASLGGLNGKTLSTNELLHANETEKINKKPAIHTATPDKGFWTEGPQVSIANPALNNQEVWIDACKGPEWDWFEKISQDAFFTSSWKIDAQSNRMGYQLINHPLQKRTEKELISTPVTRGIIQVTPDGNPLLLMADAQTIGGYPRIARVSAADLSIVAQCAPGYLVHFNLITELASIQKKITCP